MVQSRNTVFDFIRRTESNLEIIEEGAKNNLKGYYDVTQLVNSSIGLLLFPKEAIFDCIPEKPLLELKGVNLPKVLHGNLPKDNLKQLIRYLRNGFAHYNVYFENYDNSIKGLYLWNTPPNSEPDWVVYISISDLRGLMRVAAKEFKKVTEHRENDNHLSKLEIRLGKRLRFTSREALE